VFIDEETGDFLLQGWTVTDPDTLAAIAGHSPVADNESVTGSSASISSRVKARS
jgi:hypothetical protein